MLNLVEYIETTCLYSVKMAEVFRKSTHAHTNDAVIIFIYRKGKSVNIRDLLSFLRGLRFSHLS